MPTTMWHNVLMDATATARFPLLHSLRLDLQAVESGLSVATLTNFVAASGLRMADVYDVVIPARTLKHRKARKQALSADESDKLARLIRTWDRAVRVVGDPPKALYWLNKPLRRFAGRTPLHMLRTEFGARLVEEMLGQMDYGMFA
ncbi:MAG TPA: antitoxin Xre/MbcA/ParS toxin-binding domain-containing protein [Acidobacteriaceae bacterium]|jgi:putative toxin-antitoxin system antitoxin component (TIGR02293 family)|nr:antitoxin Xre/MbcA/ParS toxin-binding domain-containing protein [Acidobacteriaceae bacterium]